MIGHLVIAILVFAGVLGPVELYCELSHRRARRKRDQRARELRRRRHEQTLAVLARKPAPAAWEGDPWAFRGFNERVT